jgi:hypothetical protein
LGSRKEVVQVGPRPRQGYSCPEDPQQNISFDLFIGTDRSIERSNRFDLNH